MVLPLGDTEQQIEFSRRIQAEGLSVRAVEQAVQEMIQDDDAHPVAAHRVGAGRNARKNAATI